MQTYVAPRGLKTLGKSPIHLALQHFFKNTLSNTTLHIEYPFKSISRIADVFLPEEKWVFEIQCSPISSLEVEERMADYRSLGLQVVWILHEKTFNQNTLLAAEQLLQAFPHYFTSFNAREEGVIYDQFSLVQHQNRLFKSSKLPIDIRNIIPNPTLYLPKQIPSQLHDVVALRKKRWRLAIEGDLFSQLKTLPNPWFSRLSAQLQEFPYKKDPWFNRLTQTASSWIQTALSKTCQE